MLGVWKSGDAILFSAVFLRDADLGGLSGPGSRQVIRAEVYPGAKRYGRCAVGGWRNGLAYCIAWANLMSDFSN